MSVSESGKFSILHIASGDLWGGAEAQVHLLTTALNSHDYSNIFSFSGLVFNKGVLSERLSESTSETHIVEESEGFLKMYGSSKKYLTFHKPDLIIAHGYKASFLAFLLTLSFKIPWVLQVHGAIENHSGFSGLKALFYFKLQLFLGRFFARKIIFVSHLLKSELGFNTCSKAVVIHNAAEPSNTNDSKMSPLSPEAKDLKIIWIGRMTQIKRPDLAIKIFRDFKKQTPQSKVSLHMIGDGALLNEMKKLGEKENIPNLVFEGFLTSVSSFMQSCSILFLSSDSEGIPTVILEAMHAKIPIISRELGGVKEILERTPGYPLLFFQDSDPESPGKVIQHVVDNYSELARQAENTDVSYFRTSRMLENHCELYSSIIKNKS